MVRSLLWISLMLLLFAACNCQQNARKAGKAGKADTEAKGVHIHKAPDQHKIDSIKLEKTKQKLKDKDGSGKESGGG
jgi:hypothetical protein